MDKLTRNPGRRKRLVHAALAGGTWVQNLAATVAANVGRRSGSLIGMYDLRSLVCFHGHARSWDENRLNCITVGLNGGCQGLAEPGKATVGSPKQVALVQADTRGKNVDADLLQTGAVVRADRPIWDSLTSV